MEAKEFRRAWILDPSKEMIVEHEIMEAYHKAKVEAISDEEAMKGSEEVYGNYQKYFRVKGKYYDGFATGVNWFKEQLLKQ